MVRALDRIMGRGQDGQLNTDELQKNVMSTISWVLMISGALAGIAILPADYFRLGPFAVFASLLAQGWLLHSWGTSHRAAARILVLLGPTLTFTLAIKWIGGPSLPYYGVLAVIAGAAIDPVWGACAALANTIALVTLLPFGGALVAPVVLLWCTAAIEWIPSQALYTVLGWAWSSQERANKLLADLREHHGEMNRTLSALTEATYRLERAMHELAIAREEAEEARHIKAQFAANVSHELRTPLNLIMGFSELMHRSPEVYGKVRWTPALRADIREIYSSSRHLLAMIDDILDLSRIEAQKLPLNLEPTDLGTLIRETATTAEGLLRGKPVALHTDLPAELPRVMVDRTRIRQVLLNLLNNAARYTDEGHVTICAEVFTNSITVSVADTGIGIPEDQMSVLFEEFGQVKGPLTRSRGGTGLGLAICKQFVRLHGGSIKAESKVGVGSVFSFSLPLLVSGQAWSQLVYYAPEGWTPHVPENPLGKTAIVLGADPEATDTLVHLVPDYGITQMNTLGDLAEKVETDHPAGIVLFYDPMGPELPSPESVWRSADRYDLPIVRCEMPLERLMPRRLGAQHYLVKPIQREQLITAIGQHDRMPQLFLVADNDPGFVTLVERILRAEFPGADVRKAYSGGEVLEILRSKEPDKSFDVLILDLIMPDMNGFQVIKTLGQESLLIGLSILVVSGSGYESELASHYPIHIEVFRQNSPHKTDLGHYIKALLDEAPPDYSRPAPPARLPAAVAGIPVS